MFCLEFLPLAWKGHKCSIADITGSSWDVFSQKNIRCAFLISFYSLNKLYTLLLKKGEKERKKERKQTKQGK